MKMGVGQREKATQRRVIKLFVQELGYTYLGDLTERENSNIETELLTKFLTCKGYSPVLISRALKELQDAAGDQSVNLYDLNEQTYKKLRYGVKVSESVGQHKSTVQFVDWEHPLENDFYIAEEVTIKHKRPDLVLYINGIAFVVIELKRSTVSMSEGIRQNLTNQRPDMIMQFFATVGLVLAGNDSEGARYGTTGTPEKYYLSWKEDPNAKDEVSVAVRTQIEKYPLRLDKNLISLCRKERLVELLHNFIVFDSGVKKTCRPNQFFGNMAARDFVRRREGGIIWHTQGSGKSLTMVWLSKWIKENISDSRILIITDRDELDVQIEQVFAGVNESIVRIRRGSELIQKINDTSPVMMCSLIHKFGKKNKSKSGESDYTGFIEELKRSLPENFSPKGDFYVFVDECHRTQSGKLHKAMETILPNATFIGFTGTPLMKKDKETSLEVFGPYIHRYKFDEAVRDKVVLDLRYEAREVEQNVVQQDRIDAWFEAKTRGLTGVAKAMVDYYHYFCGANTEAFDLDELEENMPKREQLYNLSATALRAFGEVSGELQEKYHYTVEQIKALEREVTYYIKVRDDVRLASGDYVDLKKYDPDMRHLIDTYLSADPSRVLTSFGGATLVELLVDNGISALKDMPSSTPKEQEAVAETIENNIGKEIVERTQSNPKYYEKMSALLRELIEKRKNDVINYEEYLRQIVELARKVHKPESGTEYPPEIRESAAKRAFYDHLNGDTVVANQIYDAVMSSKQDNFRGSKIKERKIWRAIRAVVKDDQEADQLLALVKEQSEF